MLDWSSQLAKADESRELADGSREEIRYRRSPGQPGVRSRIRKVIGQDGMTREVWHEVIDSEGKLLHQHLKFERKPHGDRPS